MWVRFKIDKVNFKPYRILYWALILLELFNIFQHLLYIKHIDKNKDFRVTWGASFSAPYARSFGLDPKKTLESSLKDFKFNQIRIMSYWEDIQPNSSQEFNFDDLDWQLNLVERYGRKATITLGLRQPRWPECHQPKWAEELQYSSQWETKLNNFISAVVNRYKGRTSLVSWQLENEAKLRTFGDCHPKTLNEARIQKEFELVKSLDSTHPIIMSTSDQYGLPLNKPLPDIYGFSIYTRVTVPGTNLRVSYPQLPAWHGARAELINLVHGKGVVIHELQAEPWGNKPVQNLSLEEQDQTMSTQQLRYNLLYAKDTEIKQIDVWGIEWWYWRQLKFNDSSILDTAKELID